MEKIKEPVAAWLPIVLLFVFTSPLDMRMPEKGLLKPVKADVTPVKLTAAIVLLLIFDTVPAAIPVKTIPLKLPVDPVKV